MKWINAKSITTLIFILLGLIAFPLAINSHQHLYADGAFLFTQILRTGHFLVGMQGRIFGLAILHLPTLLAFQVGTSDISTLSLIYGVSLYYFPFFCYVIAIILLYRKSMHIQATLLGLMYTILVYFTSFFIVSESHFAVGLFVLSVAIISTCKMEKVAPLFALACIGLIAISSYEFWAIFFPLCIIFLLIKIKGLKIPILSALFQVILVIIYIVGFIINVKNIVFPRDAVAQAAMFSTQLRNTWPFLIVACLFFGGVVLYSFFSSRTIKNFSRSQRFISRHEFNANIPKIAFLLVMIGSFFASFILLSKGIPVPFYAYHLRTLNLFLPLIFAFSLMTYRKGKDYSTQARTIALFCVLPVLILTMHTRLYQTSNWDEFQKSFFYATQQRSGFIPINEVSITNPSLLWGWTSPSFSILMQTIKGKDVQSIIYNPDAPWQPYGPQDFDGAENLVNKMHKNLLFSEIEDPN